MRRCDHGWHLRDARGYLYEVVHDIRITPRELDVVRCVELFWRKHGKAPSYREIGLELGIENQRVLHHVRSLSAKGVLEQEWGKGMALSRTVRTAHLKVKHERDGLWVFW